MNIAKALQVVRERQRELERLLDNNAHRPTHEAHNGVEAARLMLNNAYHDLGKLVTRRFESYHDDSIAEYSRDGWTLLFDNQDVSYDFQEEERVKILVDIYESSETSLPVLIVERGDKGTFVRYEYESGEPTGTAIVQFYTRTFNKLREIEVNIDDLTPGD